MPQFSDIFTWKGWDDFGSKIFYECKLLRDIGEYASGTEFEYITWKEEYLTLEFYQEDEVLCMTKKLGIVD